MKIICRFVLPSTIINSNATQFAINPVAELSYEWGTKKIFASVEHPQTNELIEEANKVILNHMKKRLDDTNRNWAEEPPHLLRSCHTTPHSTIEETPFLLVFGTNAMIPVEAFEPIPCKILSDEGSNELILRVSLALVDDC